MNAPASDAQLTFQPYGKPERSGDFDEIPGSDDYEIKANYADGADAGRLLVMIYDPHHSLMPEWQFDQVHPRTGQWREIKGEVPAAADDAATIQAAVAACRAKCADLADIPGAEWRDPPLNHAVQHMTFAPTTRPVATPAADELGWKRRVFDAVYDNEKPAGQLTVIYAPPDAVVKIPSSWRFEQTAPGGGRRRLLTGDLSRASCLEEAAGIAQEMARELGRREELPDVEWEEIPPAPAKQLEVALTVKLPSYCTDKRAEYVRGYLEGLAERGLAAVKIDPDGQPPEAIEIGSELREIGE